MPTAHFVVYNDDGQRTFYTTRTTLPFARHFVERKKAVFDFQRFSATANPSAETDLYRVIATTNPPATVLQSLTDLWAGPHGASIAYAVTPKITAGWINMR